MTTINGGYMFGSKDHANNLSVSFKELLKNKEMVDVTLVADGHLFDAYRLVLAAISPHFRQMFTQVPANQQVFVFMKDVSKQALENLITFIYCGEVKVPEESFEDFLNTAKALEIKGLAGGCYKQAFAARKSKGVLLATTQFQDDFGHGSSENDRRNSDNKNNCNEMLMKCDAPKRKCAKRNYNATECNTVAASKPSKKKKTVRIPNLQKFKRTIVIDDEKTIDSEDELFAQDKKSVADDTKKNLNRRISIEMSSTTGTKQRNEPFELSTPSTSKQMPFSPKSKSNIKHKNKDAKGQVSNQSKKGRTSPGKPNQEKLLKFNINELLFKLHK